MLSAEVESVHGYRLRRARLGSGPPVLLLHGYPDSLQIFSRFAPLLADSHDVIAFDWPGMGASEAWPGGASPVQMAERLIELMDHWSIERAHLIGLDMGGQPALVAAAEHPERIASVTVMNSLVLWDEDTSWEIRFLRRHGFNRFVIERFPRAVFFRAEKTFLVDSQRLPNALREELWGHFRKPEVRHFVSRMCAGYEGLLSRLPAYYERIRCPTRIVWGRAEKHFPLPHAERLHGIIDGSELHVIDDGGHWMVWERANELAATWLQSFR